MTRIIRTLVRRLANAARKFTMAAVFAATLTAPITAMAQDAPILKLKENNKLHANGDGHFVYEIKLPVAAYTALKKNTTNTAVLARKMGLTDQNALVEGVKGDWNDGDSTLKLEFTARGIARAVKGDAWELPMFEGTDTDLVAVTDGMAVLTQAANVPGLGLCTSTIRIALPAGATDVKALKNPSRLSYRLPANTATSGEVKAEFEVESKEQVMSSLAKALSNKQFAALWTARTKFKNTGEQAVKDYRVRFRVAEYAPTWSQWSGTPIVVPGQTVVDGYFPVFEMEKIGKLTGQTKVAMEIQYQYKKGDGKLVEDSETKEFTLLSRNQVYYSSLRPEDCADWSDRFNLGSAVLASFVTHEDPVIQQAAGRLAKWVGGSSASLSDEEAIKYMAAVYLFMGENIAYQTPPGGEHDKKFIQHVKYGRDVLKNKAGTCIDLAILYGSMCQAVGLEPVLYNIPGHCFPAVKLPKSGRVIPVESTMIGKASFEDAVKHAQEKHIQPMLNGQMPYDEAHIAKLHKTGAVPMDLPSVGEDPLEKWGVKMPTPQVNRTEPTPTNNTRPTGNTNGGNNRQPAQAQNAVVGTWKTTFKANGMQMVGVAILNADGTGEYAWVMKGPQGNSQMSDTGTWTLKGNKLTIRATENGTVVRTVSLDGDQMDMTLDEFGMTVTFHRQK
jgi:Lipocalin-like domain